MAVLNSDIKDCIFFAPVQVNVTFLTPLILPLLSKSCVESYLAITEHSMLLYAIEHANY